MGEYLFFGLINLSILTFVLVRLFRRPVRKFLESRKDNIKTRRVRSVSSFELVKTWQGKFRSRLKNIGEHMREMMEKAESEGERDGQMMLVEAEEVADRVIEQAMIRADHEVKKRNKEFYVEIVDKSVARAKKQLEEKLTVDDQVSLGKRFLEALRS